jgi:peptidoglycan/LPS O-acetylase OafA/YrhL
MGGVRLFLALVVAVDHWRLFVLAPAGRSISDQVELGFNAAYAVLFFYVISGFLITYTLSRNYTADGRGAVAFYRNRFVRIFSLYWPVAAIAFLALPEARAQFADAGLVDKAAQLLLVGQDWRKAFGCGWTSCAPGFSPLVAGVEQAWTLGAELVFYAMAPLLVRSWRAPLALLAASLAVRAAFVWRLGPAIDPWTYNFLPSTLCFFLFGVVACRAGREWRRLATPAIGFTLLGLSLAAMLALPDNLLDGPRLWLSILPFAAALPGLFASTKDSRALNFLGDLSYPVYLSHLLVIALVARPLLSPFVVAGDVAAATMCFVAMVAAAAIAARYALERPVARLMKRSAVPRTASAAAPSRP